MNGMEIRIFDKGSLVQKINELRAVLQENGLVLGAVFVGAKGEGSGFLFADSTPPKAALDMLEDMKDVIPETILYWKGKLQ